MLLKPLHIENVKPPECNLTEIIHKDDPRAKDPRMLKVIAEELRDLLKRSTFKVVIKEEIPDGSNVLTARFFLAIKSKEDGSVRCKARYIAGGHRDILKRHLVHNIQTLKACVRAPYTYPGIHKCGQNFVYRQ